MSAQAATAMDRMYRYQRHFYDLTRKHYLLGRDRLLRDLNVQPGQTVLEIGCGTGRNLICAAELYPQARFYGVDVSAAMLDTARAAIDKAGLADRISVAQADATDFNPHSVFGIAAFDRVFISYALSMIPPWQQAFAHAATLVAAGGSLHLVDFGDGADLPGWFRKALLAWLDMFHVTPRTNLATEVAHLSSLRGLPHRFTALYGGYAALAQIG